MTDDAKAESRTVAVVPEHAELAEVVDGVVVETEVVEGVVVDEAAPVVQSVVLRPVRVVKIVVAHEHTKTAGRHLAYVPLGASVVAKRLWDSRTTARYERCMRAGSYFVNVEASASDPSCTSACIGVAVAGTLEADVSAS